jgi:hypothetical protein
MVTRSRCAGCGKRFTPVATCQRTQQVCCKECRLARRRKQAKQRRQADLEGYRADERKRQQKLRDERRAAAAESAGANAEREPCHEPSAEGSATKANPPCHELAAAAGGCHGPASDAKPSELQGLIAAIVVEAVCRSRTALDQELRRMVRKIRPLVQSERARGGP